MTRSIRQKKALLFALPLAALPLGCGPTAENGPGPASAGQNGNDAAQPKPAQVKPQGGNNLLKNSTFEDGTSLPWASSFTAPGEGKAAVVNGAFCIDVKNAGSNAWDAQVRHREMVIRKGHTYSVRFKAWASRATKMRPKV